MNGDGYSDVFVCPFAADWPDAGLQPIAGRLVYGPIAGTVAPEDDDAVFVSPNGVGGACAIVGDSDGDTYGDVVIDALALPGVTDGGVGGGGAFLFYGPFEGTIDVSTADVTFRDETGSWAGWEVEPAGDLDGNGLGDFLLGAPSAFQGRGAVYLILGGGGF